MRTADYALVRNPAFGTWLFIAAAAYAAHLLYRFAAKPP